MRVRTTRPASPVRLTIRHFSGLVLDTPTGCVRPESGGRWPAGACAVSSHLITLPNAL